MDTRQPKSESRLPLRILRKWSKSGFRLTNYERQILERYCRGETGSLELVYTPFNPDDDTYISKSLRAVDNAILTGGRIRIEDPPEVGVDCLIEVRVAYPRKKWGRV